MKTTEQCMKALSDARLERHRMGEEQCINIDLGDINCLRSVPMGEVVRDPSRDVFLVITDEDSIPGDPMQHGISAIALPAWAEIPEYINRVPMVLISWEETPEYSDSVPSPLPTGATPFEYGKTISTFRIQSMLYSRIATRIGGDSSRSVLRGIVAQKGIIPSALLVDSSSLDGVKEAWMVMDATNNRNYLFMVWMEDGSCLTYNVPGDTTLEELDVACIDILYDKGVFGTHNKIGPWCNHLVETTRQSLLRGQSVTTQMPVLTLTKMLGRGVSATDVAKYFTSIGIESWVQGAYIKICIDEGVTDESAFEGDMIDESAFEDIGAPLIEECAKYR